MLTHTHTNYYTKIARRSIAGMSYAALTTLFDSTYSERIPRDLPRTWAIYESRSLRVSRHPESRRETNGSLSIKAHVTIVLDASVACLRSPETHENRKLRAKPERQRNTKWRQNGRFTDGIAYVAHNIEMGSPILAPSSKGMILGSVLSVLSTRQTRHALKTTTIKRTTFLDKRPRQSECLDLTIQGR